MTLSPTSRMGRKDVEEELVLPLQLSYTGPASSDDDDEATISPLSKFSRRPDVDDESTAPPPVNRRGHLRNDTVEQESVEPPSDEYRLRLSDANAFGHDERQDSVTSEDAESSQQQQHGDTSATNQETVASTSASLADQMISSPQPTVPVPDPDEEESIALARLLMEQEAIESYGALSADFLRYNAHQFSQEDLAALQAAMADDEAEYEGSDEGGGDAVDQPFSYDVMLRLGESIGDVKKERWNLVAQTQIDKLETFKFDPKTVEGKDENDCDVKCLVCQFPYEAGESLRRLPCSHAFHSECVDGWLKDNDVCPYCRQTIVQE